MDAERIPQEITSSEPGAGWDRLHIRGAAGAPRHGLRLQPQHSLVGGQGHNSIENKH